MKIAQLCALVAVMTVALSVPVHTQDAAQPLTFSEALEASFGALPSPLVCESRGAVYEGRTPHTKPATPKSEAADFDDAEGDAGDAVFEAQRWAAGKKLRCAEGCALSFFAFPRFALLPGGPPPKAADHDYLHWDIYYQCKRPPPVILNLMAVPKPGGGASGSGGGSSGNPSGTSATGSGEITTEDLCKKREKKIQAIAADDEKAERAQRDIQSQIDAALSRGEEPSADLLQQANAIRNERANNATWIKVLQKCEDPSLLNSVFGDVSIGIGVGGGSQQGRPNNTQPNNPGPNNQPPPGNR
jgi:hypothetical protein